MSKLAELPPIVKCPHCPKVLVISDELAHQYFTNYFEGNNNCCPWCKNTFDWWKTVLQAILQNSEFVTMAPLGAQITVFKITIMPDCPIKLRFADHGIPTNAKVLNLSYGPNAGKLLPVEDHGSVPQRHTIPPEIELYPVPIGEEPHGKTRVTVAVAWIRHTPDDQVWQNLTDAFQLYLHGRYESAVIPANVAVESTMSRLLADFLKTVVSRKRVKEHFEKDDVTYNRQLNLWLPVLLSFTNAPVLPSHIRGSLNRLKDRRDEIAHHGKLENRLEVREAAECLCAALFGFHYLRLARSFLLEE